MSFSIYKNTKGENIFFTGKPDLDLLEKISLGPGDIWHSSLNQGYRNTFQDLVYFAATFWWHFNDYDGLNSCVSWRVNPQSFAIRENVWKQIHDFDNEYTTDHMRGLDFGFKALKYSGAVVLYQKGLFNSEHRNIEISTKDRYLFYRKNLKYSHAFYMLLRKGFWKFREWKYYLWAKKNAAKAPEKLINNQPLKPLKGKPTVSYIIPTMMRQEYTLQLLNDLKNQTYLPTQVVIVDATPEKERDQAVYNFKDFPFEITLKWQITKGSCRARNEAIALCTKDYIIFGDDDIRLQKDFVENHLRFLQTYKVGACNGLDIMADHHRQDFNDLERKLGNLEDYRLHVSVSHNFNNANSCVRRDLVNQLVGNDINYDGGYGEDADFGLSLFKIGITVLYNPFSRNLHLKPPSGGYRFWGRQAKVLGKKRKKQPWELDTPVKKIKPVPSPTIMYLFEKHFNENQKKEYKFKYFLFYLIKNKKATLIFRLLKIPFKLLQYKKSVFYAKKLNKLGPRYK
ncbi:glycosyltransferase [Psychroflexus sp. CAK57W]|uniref:glycosyltransferase family 2 protein n=1 Tax=Psychroflexus curvus TaxID=2873595 RepID=UPI001CCDDDD0|nr:glycosyltransferase [Psychroflexus curvus]MBZ9787824.1 glycosyltransferase [Psychroflexus curvus]